MTSRWLDAAAEAAAEVGPGDEHPLLRMLGPFHAMFQMENEQAMQLLTERYDDPDPWVAAMARTMRTALMVNFGHHHDEAQADAEDALRRFEALGERWGTSLSLGVLAQLTGLRGEHAAAAGFYRRSIALASELGTHEDTPQFLAALGLELLMVGDLDGARAALAEGHRIADAVGMAESLTAVAFAEGELARRTGDNAAARRWLERAAEHAGATGVASQWRASAEAAIGHLDAAEGDLASARRRLDFTLQTALASMDAPIVAHVLVAVADLSVRAGDADRAAAMLGAVESILGLAEPALPERARVAAATRAALGEAGFAAGYARGRRVRMADVADLAALT
jgi:tetratricopeptide (TPR) repeat protein